ncbi:MAG: winged helix-turn-helix transcriptional regulator [Clostridia bacterium]|nr:winged helix-turn-helix transcriptional regulator [Clostridia bacterium]
MAHITFLDAPGQLHDLFFLFVLHFNRDVFFADSSTFQITPEEQAHYRHLLENTPPISNDLLIFFKMNNSGKCMMSHHFFDNKADLLVNSGYNLSKVREELNRTTQIIEKVLTFYFPFLSEEDIIQCETSISAVSKVIKSSSLSHEQKVYLYDFFIDPESAIRKLSDELLEKSILQQLDYNRNYSNHLKLRDGFILDDVAQMLKSINLCNIDISIFQEVLVTFCSYAETVIYCNIVNGMALLMLGSDYLNVLAMQEKQSVCPDLKNFCQAISDANRQAILDLIHKRREVSAKDVEQELQLSAPNTYYHLSLMIKSGVLKTRNIGKSVFYSINTSMFQDLAKKLQLYTNGGLL